jgi:hypothetical protein
MQSTGFRLLLSQSPSGAPNAMAEADVISNQHQILENQKQILANQKEIKDNQQMIKKNQDKLDRILSNQLEILALLKK